MRDAGLRFSVILPTRNRPETLQHALATCLAQDFEDFEIIVCDNSDREQAGEVAAIVAAAASPKVRLLPSERPLDIDIRAHNRSAIEAHPMFKRISMIEGSSIAPEIVEQVRQAAAGRRSVLVCLDSNHTHVHVLAELQAYASLVTVGSYCVVFDTVVEDLPKSLFPDRPWGPGDNPKTAVHEFLKTHGAQFEIDRAIDNKLLVSVAPDGYLKRVA